MLALVSIFVNKTFLVSALQKTKTDPGDLARPPTKRAVSQVRPSSIVDATTSAALLTVAADAISFMRLRNRRRRADIGSRLGEIRRPALRRLVSRGAGGGAGGGGGEQGKFAG